MHVPNLAKMREPIDRERFPRSCLRLQRRRLRVTQQDVGEEQRDCRQHEVTRLRSEWTSVRPRRTGKLELTRWPIGWAPPLRVPMTKNCMKSKLAWKPTASQSDPVRCSVKHKSRPSRMMFMMSIAFSCGFVRCAAPKSKESNTAAGQNPMPRVSACSG